MGENNFSDSAVKAIEGAFELAKEGNHPEASENHLLLAFLSDPDGYFRSLLTEIKADPDRLLQLAKETVAMPPDMQKEAATPNPHKISKIESVTQKHLPKNSMIPTSAPTTSSSPSGKVPATPSPHGKKRAKFP